MKEKIEQLSRGEFVYELPKILLSEEELNISIETGSIFEGSFTICNSNFSQLKGILYSSSQFLFIDKMRFVGDNNLIIYHVIGESLKPGEVICANIAIITNCGEMELPVRIQVEEPSLISSIGKIKDMFQFTNLVNENWSEAKQLFKSKELYKILNYNDKKYSLIYHSLLKGSGMSQAMDEFLVSLRKKIEVKLNVEKMLFEYEASVYSFMDKIVLLKEGWGYAQIRISTDAPFIELERKIIWADNFVGNSFDLNFVIKAEGMKDGIHYGYIYITTIQQCIKIRVKVVRSRDDLKERNQRRNIRSYKVKLFHNYLAFRFQQATPVEYLEKANELLSRLKESTAENPNIKLYQIHLEMILGEDNDAQENLKRLEEELKLRGGPTVVEEGVMVYLNALLYKTTNNLTAITEKLQELHAKHPSAWILLWCLLYLDKGYEYNRHKKYMDMKQQCSSGCKSPIFYFEVASLLNEDPSLLKSLESFELCVLAFALRKEFMTLNLARQATYIATKVKIDSKLLFYILKKIYEIFHLKETLGAICTLLIRNHKADQYFHVWYKKGVEAQLRITELPEYYMYSIDEDKYELLNHSMLAYFSYNNKLSGRKKSYLYANIIANKELDPVTYKNYVQIINNYALQKLESKSIDRHLAIIYDEVLHQIELDVKVAKILPDIAFYYQVECLNPNICDVVVVHNELKDETVTPLVEGRALVELITNNTEIFLLDEKSNRYHVTIDYTIHKLLHLNDLFTKCYELYQDNWKLLLHLAECYQRVDKPALDLRKKLLRTNKIDEELKLEYQKYLINNLYGSNHSSIDICDFEQVNLQLLDKDSRRKLIEIMLLYDMNDQAVKALEEYGYEQIDLKQLLKICSKLICKENGEFVKIAVVVDICYYVYSHGKYDELILKYLVRYYNGTTYNMYELWQAAKNFDVDTIDLEERLLSQILFAESYVGSSISVFMSYYRNGYNRKLIRAFLSFYAYKYLVKERHLEAELFDVIKRETSYEKNDVCLLALLKYYSGKEMLIDSEQKFVDYQMDYFEQKDIVLPFFKDIKLQNRLSLRTYDKYFVEYQTDPKNKVAIHYMIEGKKENLNFITETMVNVCYGIFVKEFILFENETLQYYITEEDETGSNITESKSIRLVSEMNSKIETNYHRLNRMVQAIKNDENEIADNLIEQYLRMEYGIGQLFKPLND